MFTQYKRLENGSFFGLPLYARVEVYMLKDRDLRQRTVGFISFSFLTHCGLIALAFLAPNMIKEMGQSSKQSETYLVDSPTSSATIGETAQAEPQLVAAKVEAQPVDAEPVVEKAEDTTAVVAKPLPAKKLPTPAKEKAETATKKVLALPTKKAAAPKKVAQKVQTVDQSELEVNQALKNAREQEESKPEVAADIEVPETQEQAQAPAQEEVAAETPAVESATTQEETKTEEAKQEAAVAPAVAAPVQKAAPAKEQPLIAPITRGAQNATAPQSQVGGLAPATTTAGNSGAAAGGAIRDADSLMEQPGNARPAYPEEDQRAGRQGVVVFDAMVTKDGSVQGIQLRQSSGASSLDASAYEAFRKHHYLPGQEGMVRKKFQFVLNGEKTLPARLRRR